MQLFKIWNNQNGSKINTKKHRKKDKYSPILGLTKQ